LKKIIKAAIITAGISIGANHMYHCLSRMIAKSLIRVYTDAIDSGAVVTLTLKMPENRRHKEED
jgi:hypothetical protein